MICSKAYLLSIRHCKQDLRFYWWYTCFYNTVFTKSTNLLLRAQETSWHQISNHCNIRWIDCITHRLFKKLQKWCFNVQKNRHITETWEGEYLFEEDISLLMFWCKYHLIFIFSVIKLIKNWTAYYTFMWTEIHLFYMNECSILSSQAYNWQWSMSSIRYQATADI